MYLTLRLEKENREEGGKLKTEMSSAAGISDTVLRRLFVTDRSSGKQFLVDTGADVSVIPKMPGAERSKSNFTCCKRYTYYDIRSKTPSTRFWTATSIPLAFLNSRSE